MQLQKLLQVLWYHTLLLLTGQMAGQLNALVCLCQSTHLGVLLRVV